MDLAKIELCTGLGEDPKLVCRVIIPSKKERELRIDSFANMAFWMTVDCAALIKTSTNHTVYDGAKPYWESTVAITGRGIKHRPKFEYIFYEGVLTVTDRTNIDFKLVITKDNKKMDDEDDEEDEEMDDEEDEEMDDEEDDECVM